MARAGLILAGAALVLAAPARAAPDPALAAELLARTQAMADAIGRGDAKIWDAALDPAVVYVTENNVVMDKAAVLADLQPPPAEVVAHTRVTEFALQRHGDMAVATYVNDEALGYYGQPLRTRFRVTDSWHRDAQGWCIVGSQTLAVLEDPPAVTLAPAALAAYAGRYVLAGDVHYVVRTAGGRLYGRRDGGAETELLAEAPDLFFVAGRPRSRKVFFRDAHGRVTGFGDRREGRDIVWKREG